MAADVETLMAKVIWNGGEDECWTWEGSMYPNGYGRKRLAAV